jgi:hypothetical protein
MDHNTCKKRGLLACRWGLFLLLGCLLLNCGGSSGASDPDDGGSGQTTRSFRIGVAPIPRNFPGSAEDWLDMFSRLDCVAEIVTAQSGWRDSVDESGNIPEFIALMGDQKDVYGYEPLFGINFFEQSGAYDPDLNTNSNPANDWTNNNAKDLYKQTALAICSSYNPTYLGLAIEVNEYYLTHETDFDRFLVFYKELYATIKAAYPNVQVFVTFQLEMMKGIGDNTWGFTVDPHWELLDRFGDQMDLAVFTTYPEVEYDSPDDLPDDYYLDISNHTDKPIAISEVGWSSTKYSENDQARFIDTFIRLTQNMDLTFVNWIFMHDLPDATPLTKTGLRQTGGTAKQAWYKWQALKQRPYRP